MTVEKLKCKVCGQEFTKIDCVTRHAKIVHKIEPKQYYDKFFKTETDGLCKCCGVETQYWNLANGYREFCTRKCFWKYTNNLDETKEKRKQTCLEKYGSNNYMQSNDFKEKSKETCLKEYGVVNGGGSLESIQKIKQTKLERYGNENWNNCNAEEKEAATLEKFKKDCSNIEILSYHDKKFACKCKTCNKEFDISYQALYHRIYTFNTPACIYCNPLETFNSNNEVQVTNYIKDAGIDVIENDRSILNGREIDIYVPAKKLAFEYDGLYWHSELYKDKKYHLDKTKECEAQGIQLVHIFEDEWLYKQDIVKSRIKGLLGLNERLFARKCVVKEVNYKESEQFLNENHIQGNCSSKYRYGLYYNDELVSIMTFGKSRFKDTEFELLRFCNKLNLNVIGAASRLFNHFMKDHTEIPQIISFADRRWSMGNVYEKLGFEKCGETVPAYFYIVDNLRQNRISYQKHKLIANDADLNKTEHELMLERGIYRIYDCGNLKYIYTR